MCLDDQILNTYLDGELAEPWKSQVEEHLSYCAGCKIRYEKLQQLRSVIKSAELTKEEIDTCQERVLSLIEKNYLNKQKKVSFLRRQLKMSISQLAGIAAAFVIVFVGSWSIMGSKTDQYIPAPEVQTSVAIENITPVKTYETSTVKSLNSFTLEQILQNLDERGYDVDIRLKSITPLTEEPIEEVVEK